MKNKKLIEIEKKLKDLDERIKKLEEIIDQLIISNNMLSFSLFNGLQKKELIKIERRRRK